MWVNATRTDAPTWDSGPSLDGFSRRGVRQRRHGQPRQPEPNTGPLAAGGAAFHIRRLCWTTAIAAPLPGRFAELALPGHIGRGRLIGLRRDPDRLRFGESGLARGLLVLVGSHPLEHRWRGRNAGQVLGWETWSAGGAGAVQRPVCPKPPVPRSLVSKVSTGVSRARTTGTKTSCASRSKGCSVKGASPRFQQDTISSPW